MILFVVFFLTPIAEMYLLIEVAGYINALPTIGLVMLTAVIGVALLKQQGLATLTRGVGRLNRGEIPAREMAEGILLAVAGAFLITPGFITDTVGFTLLFPPSRSLIAGYLLKRVELKGHMHGAGFGSGVGTGTGAGSEPSQSPYVDDRPFHGTEGAPGEVIEGDFERKPE